jgi:hypothetical protein
VDRSRRGLEVTQRPRGGETVYHALAAGLLLVPRTFGNAPLYVARSDTFEILHQTGDDTTNEIAPPDVAGSFFTES